MAKSKVVEAEISAEHVRIGIAPQTIWPERYDEKGVAIPSRRKVGRRWTDRKMEYQLDLSEGLWLPMRDLTGLPGMGNDVTFIIMHGENLGWKIRESVAFETLNVVFRGAKER